MKHFENTIDFTRFDDDDVLINYDALKAQDDDSLDSFDSLTTMESMLTFSAITNEDDTSEDSQEQVESSRQLPRVSTLHIGYDDILMCNESIDDIDRPAGVSSQKPPRPPRRVENASIKRGPVFITKLFDVPPNLFTAPPTSTMEYELQKALSKTYTHREVLWLAYAVQNGWTDKLMSLQEIKRYGTPADYLIATKGISNSDRKFAMAHRVCGGYIDILRELEYNSDVCDGGVMYYSGLAWTTAQGCAVASQKALADVLMVHAERDPTIKEMRKSTPSVTLLQLINNDAVVHDYVTQKIKVPLAEVTAARRAAIMAGIKNGICGFLNINAALVIMLRRQLSDMKGGPFDHAHFKRVVDTHEGRVVEWKEYDSILSKVLKAADMDEDARQEIVDRITKKAGHEAKRRLVRNAQSAARYKERKAKKMKRTPEGRE
jgi:hypothetical protein